MVYSQFFMGLKMPCKSVRKEYYGRYHKYSNTKTIKQTITEKKIFTTVRNEKSEYTVAYFSEYNEIVKFIKQRA